MSTAALYTPEVLALATGLAQWPLDAGLPLRGEARSPVCGSEIAMGLALDPAGAVIYPQLNLYMVERGSNKIPQNVPIPFRLFGTPAADGVQVNAANQLTATGPKNVKLINKVFPFRDNIELYISGQNPIGNPAFVDVALVGYLIPSTEKYMWQKGA